MKNLRKVLALVLVVALAFGLVTVASAKQVGDYSDASSVKYTEAVDLLTGLNIMQGGGGTAFDPTGTFTREMAAKVICTIILGNTVASNLGTTTTSFKDVDASRWSAGYIQYCTANNIINGDGSGNFNPTAPVTGSVMAKLLLTAIGYGTKGEYTGANWEINTIAKASQIGILDTNVDYRATATREQVAQYVFNTLTKTSCYTVTYNVLTGAYNGTYITANPNLGPTAQEKFEAGLGYLTFKLKSIDASGMGVAYPNVTAHYWKAYFGTTNYATVSGVYNDDVVLATSTNGTSLITLTSATLNGTTNAFYKASYDNSVRLFFNGVDVTPVMPPNTLFVPTVLADYNTTMTSLTQGANANLNAVADVSGVVVNLLDNDKDGKVDVVSVIEKYVTTVSAIPTVDAAGTVTFTGLTGSPFVKGAISYPANLALKDNISVVPFGQTNPVTYVEKNTKVTGQLTATNTTSGPNCTATFAGTTYTAAALFGTSSVSAGSLVAATQNVAATGWVDANGYLVSLTVDPVSSFYGLVTGYTRTLADGLNPLGSAQVRLYTNDGKVAVYPQAVVAGVLVDYTAGGQPLALLDSVAPGLNTGILVRYKINGDGTVELFAPANVPTPVSAYTAKAGNITIGGSTYYFTPNTKVIYYDNGSQYNAVTNVATFLTGYGATQTIDTNTGAKDVTWVVTKDANGLDTNQLDTIYFDMSAPTTGGNFAYFLNNGYTIRYVNSYAYYDYTAYVNGTSKTISYYAGTTAAPNPITAKGLVTYNVDTNGNMVNPQYISAGVVINYTAPTVEGKVTYADSGYVGYMTGAATYGAVSVNSSTVYYLVTATTVTASATLPVSDGPVVVDIQGIQYSTVPNTAAAIYYTVG